MLSAELHLLHSRIDATVTNSLNGSCDHSALLFNAFALHRQEKKKGPESDILTCTDSVTSTERYKDERIIIYRVNGIMAARMSGGHESLL